MKQLQKRLNNLYEQKALIEKEISQLEAQLYKPKSFSKQEKIELFKTLFLAREDVFLKHWVSKDKQKESFFNVTKTFQGQDYISISDTDIEQHLRGNVFLASYVISKENVCKYIVIQCTKEHIFDFVQKIKQLDIYAYVCVDSKMNYNAWIFFDKEIPAKQAREFALFLLQYTHINGKIFPNQDFSNVHSFGSFIELPLHLKKREKNQTVFISAKNFMVFEDQWAYLYDVKKISRSFVQKYTSELSKKDVISSFTSNQKVFLSVYDYIYLPLNILDAKMVNYFKSLASFENPQVKTLQALRKPLYNIPRIIRSYEEDESFLKLPRGLLSKVKTFFEEHNIFYEIEDKRYNEKEEFNDVSYVLREEQNQAIEKISKSDFSICVAPPGFGKTLIGAKMIEIRKVNTLILVNKNMLLDQWIERFIAYFNMDKKDIGFLGKSKNKLNNHLDVATMQSLKNHPELIKNYSFVIVDECHHIPAITFEQIIKSFHGKYILGLSATPNRKDGLQPILFQQLGEISYEHKKIKTVNHHLKVIKTNFRSEADNYSQIINELCDNKERNEQIINEIKHYSEKKILLLTDRIEHIKILEILLKKNSIKYISIHGSMSKKEQTKSMNEIESSKLILATTSYFGEGVDFPHLNTIIFATPISYYGRLVQYLGRVGRDGQPCLAIDFLDSNNAMLNSAFKKRAEGYKLMHYKKGV